MSAAACARTAADLTALVHRLGRTRVTLVRQSRLPEEEFSGLSGDAYRRHVARSAVAVAGAASDLALLAGALAALGRELDAAEGIRDLAAGSPPERARALRARAHDIEHRGQQRWRAAVAAYQGRVGPGRQSGQQPIGQPVVPGTAPWPAAEPVAPASPVAATPGPQQVAAAAPPAVAAATEPTLETELVIPPTVLESELVPPPAEPARCGSPEGRHEHR